ncbi:hypothetical protein CC99x_005235 [Candidatus Berkiella cookevillensis]|uniref:Uncharacterized protein n=1 Tax=Candidatus Berkiella cookevillensis TaxID=437022 RepID=A0AAE3L727_9GAMM|nr:hypothetical protein [Candidatus Berkiella cookevillensis]MCS5708304.1 hypothetical protein [Candidatus Berkiella cookevillensis]
MIEKISEKSVFNIEITINIYGVFEGISNTLQSGFLTECLMSTNQNSTDLRVIRNARRIYAGEFKSTLFIFINPHPRR